MAKTVRVTSMVGLVGYNDNSPDAAGDLFRRIAFVDRAKFGTGSGDNQADRYYEDLDRELESAPKSYELDSLDFDPFGETITFTKIRGIIIQNLTLTTGHNLAIGGDFNALGVVPALVYPGSVVAISVPVDGFPVASGSTDTLTIDSGSNTVSYNLLIWGND